MRDKIEKSESSTYVAICNRANFDGYYFRKFKMPEGNKLAMVPVSVQQNEESFESSVESKRGKKMRHLIIAPIVFMLGCGGAPFSASENTAESESGSSDSDSGQQQEETGSHNEAGVYTEASAQETGNPSVDSGSVDSGSATNDTGTSYEAGQGLGNLNCVGLLANQPADSCTPYIGFVSLQFTRGANGTSENFLRVAVYDGSQQGQGLITTSTQCGASPLPACYKVYSCANWDGSATCGFSTRTPCPDMNVTYTLGTATANYSSFLSPMTVTQVQIDSNWSVMVNGNSVVLANSMDTWTLSCQVSTQDN